MELAEMAALPPFAQVIADMDGLGSFGSRRRGVCVHGGNLSREFQAFHYLRRNRIPYPPGSSSPSQEMTHEHAFPTQHLLTRRHDPLAAQSGNPAAGAHPRHAGVAG